MSTTPEAPTIAERVARGAAWLDREAPGWDSLIDLASLRLSNPCLCVLGQVFARAADEAKSVFVEDGFDYATLSGSETDGLGLGCAAPYGFDVADEDYDSYALLDTEWTRVITARRSS